MINVEEDTIRRSLLQLILFNMYDKEMIVNDRFYEQILINHTMMIQINVTNVLSHGYPDLTA